MEGPILAYMRLAWSAISHAKWEAPKLKLSSGNWRRQSARNRRRRRHVHLVVYVPCTKVWSQVSCVSDTDISRISRAAHLSHYVYVTD